MSGDFRGDRGHWVWRAGWARYRSAFGSLVWLAVTVSLVVMAGLAQEGPPEAIYGQSWVHRLYQPLLLKSPLGPAGMATATATVATGTATVATGTATVATGTATVATGTATVATGTATVATGTATMTVTPATGTATVTAVPPLAGLSLNGPDQGTYRPDPAELLRAKLHRILGQ